MGLKGQNSVKMYPFGNFQCKDLGLDTSKFPSGHIGWWGARVHWPSRVRCFLARVAFEGPRFRAALTRR
jgi:hypothetical protein